MTKMLKKLQQVMIQLSARAERAENARMLRRLVVGTAAAFRGPGAAARTITGIAETAARHEAEIASWVSAETLAAGLGGPFDACDLRHWLVLADLAGIPAVPAREILRLDEEEMSLLSGSATLPDRPATRRIQAGLAEAAIELGIEADAATRRPEIDREALTDRLFEAMDDVPEGWMVRSNRCGGSELKTLSGFGAIDRATPEVRFGPDLEVGPGWVRVGNRRHVNVSDNRTVTAAAQGPGFLTFLARPWRESSRYLICDDPHRHGTPFAGKGMWPAEWRAIVQGGRVVGVASYFGWADSATPETAAIALEVRVRAQAIVDQALAQGAFPRYPDIELVRDAAWMSERPGLSEAMDGDWGRETVSCTLDFLETEDGPTLLEGGPGVSPFGGGHPCAFAGVIEARLGVVPVIQGVAFRIMDHVTLADPKTWTDGDHTDRILTWEQVESLAAGVGA